VGREALAADWSAPRWIGPACLIATLAVATVLRFYNLWQRGFVYWDEGKFALEGVRMQAALHSLFISGGAVTAGKAVGTAKPTHALLIGLAYAIFGVRDYAPLYLDAACSVAQVGVVYLIARRLFGIPTAVLGALFLAVSEYDVIYARSVLSESDANLLLLCGVLVWVVAQSGVGKRAKEGPAGISEGKGAWWGIFGAGMLMGLSFTTNYRLVVYVAAIVGFDLVWTWRRSGLRVMVRRGPLWALGLVIFPVAWQSADVITRAHGLALFRSEITGSTWWYFREVIYQLHEGKQSVTHFNPVAYVQWYVWRSGAWMLVLLLAGIALAVWRRSYAWMSVAAPVVIPFLIYMFAPFIVPRNLDAALPFAAVLSAAAVVSVVQLVSENRARLVFVLSIAVVLGAAGAAMSWRLTAERSGYAQAASYVQLHDGGRAVASNEIVVFYLRGSGRYCLAPNLRSNIYRLSADVRAGYRYAVIDHFSWKLAKLVRARMPNVARISATGPISVGENLIASENGNLASGITPTYINIYRLVPARLPAPRGATPDMCSRDQV
jgi:4-amino-4-deoxy-L-arabinose transferase-like glycosyltransferase